MEMFLTPLPGVFISQLICFARVCTHVDDFNNRNNFLTSKLLKQGYQYYKLLKAFSKFYYRHSELIVKYNICLKTLMQQGISEIVSEYDQEIPQSQTTDNPVAPRGRAAQPSQDTRKTN